MHQLSLCTLPKAWKSFLDAAVLDQFSLQVESWGLSVKESNFPFSHLPQISQSVLQPKFESGEDGEQVYGDWDQCSRKLWDSRDLAWQLQYAPLFSTPCQAPAEAICLGDAACPDIYTKSWSSIQPKDIAAVSHPPPPLPFPTVGQWQHKHRKGNLAPSFRTTLKIKEF